MRIKVLAVENKKVEEGKKNYNLLDVSYKNLEFNKVEGKKLVSFASPDVYNALKDAKAGDEFDVTKGDKSAAGFVPWTRCVVAGEATLTEDSRQVSGAAPASTASKSTPRSTYETPEERAKKQVYIVRQSSIGAAIELLNLMGNKKASVEEVTSIAKQFEQYVFGNDPMQELIDMEDDIPL